MNGKVEVFYTGGGIWIAEATYKENLYAVVSSDAPEYLAIYKYAEEEGQYYPEDMILDKHKDELDEELKVFYDVLSLALKLYSNK